MHKNKHLKTISSKCGGMMPAVGLKRQKDPDMLIY